MNYTKPLVTLGLDEYNGLLKYIETLELLTSDDNPYKKSLILILEQLRVKSEPMMFHSMDFNNNNNFPNAIDIIKKNGVNVQIESETNKILLTIKK